MSAINNISKVIYRLGRALQAQTMQLVPEVPEGSVLADVYVALQAVIDDPKFELYGLAEGPHDGTTLMGHPDPAGYTEHEVALEVIAEFSEDPDGDSIELSVGPVGAGFITLSDAGDFVHGGIQSDGDMLVAPAETPPDAVATKIIEHLDDMDDLKTEAAGEILDNQAESVGVAEENYYDGLKDDRMTGDR